MARRVTEAQSRKPAPSHVNHWTLEMAEPALAQCTPAAVAWEQAQLLTSSHARGVALDQSRSRRRGAYRKTPGS